MKANVTRRHFLAATGTAALAATTASALAAEAGGSAKPLKILGVACSPRKGMTTAKAVAGRPRRRQGRGSADSDRID